MATNQKIAERRDSKLKALKAKWAGFWAKSSRREEHRLDELCEFVGTPVVKGKGHSKRGDQVIANRAERRAAKLDLKKNGAE